MFLHHMQSNDLCMYNNLLCRIRGGALTIIIYSAVGVTTSRVWFWPKNTRKGVSFFLTKNERGCVFEQRVYYSMTILENSRCCAPLFSNFFIKGNILAEFARKMAHFSPKHCKRKIMVSLAHPCTKIRQVHAPLVHRINEKLFHVIFFITKGQM